MKILLLTDGITPFVMGGMQRHSFYLADYLSRLNGVEVHLVHCVPEGEDCAGIKTIIGDRENLLEIILSFPSPGKFPGHYLRRSKAYSKQVFSYVTSRYRLSDFDFIYAKGFVAWQLLRRKNAHIPPVAVNFHGFEMFQTASGTKQRLEQALFRNPVRYICSKADYVVSYGGKVTDLVRSIGVLEPKIVEIPSGIDEDWLIERVSSRDHTVRKALFIGRNERRKGLSEFHQAILSSSLDMEFHFIGPIADEEQLNDRRCIYHGAHSDVMMLRKLTSNCDLLVLPSYSEGMPNVILEAMASGLAILATDVGAVSTMVDHNNGWLIARPDPVLIRKALECAEAIGKDELLTMRKNSVQKVRDHFLWTHIASITIKEIKQRVRT